jgi:predicted transcriptional regulator of viral defense system
MNATEAFGRLRRLGMPAATTADAAAVLGLSTAAASLPLQRLASAGLVTPVRRGALGSFRTARSARTRRVCDRALSPYPSYISLQTALYRRGMVTQIPSMIYLVSLARSDRIETGLGTYSVHHIRPELLGGFEYDPVSGTKLAVPEKALFGFLYLSPTRGRLFAALPELELPPGFRRSEVRAWADRIPSPRSRSIVRRKLDEVLAHA